MDANFLQKEERSGFLVTTERKALWQVELGLLGELERVCKKYNIQYYADGGTLLGAVRHHGFIPWDDDIDVQMHAEDYNKLCEVAEKEFTYPYFFQTYQSEKGFGPFHAKLRDCRTTGQTQYEKENCPSWHRGIFLDIFPLYYIPKKRMKYRWQCLCLNSLKVLIAGYELEERRKFHKSMLTTLDPRRLLWCICSVFTNHRRICDRYTRIAGWEKTKTEMVGVTSFAPGNCKLIWPARLFDEVIDLPFEDRSIQAPVAYDERLRIQYGDYMIEVRNGATHSDLTWDASKPYTEG